MTAWARLQTLDDRLCVRFYRAARPSTIRTFAALSRLGDGHVWGLCILLAPFVGGPAGPALSLRLAVVGLATFALYRLIKAGAARPRPFMVRPDIDCRVPALDLYAFPSGHTMHAAAFSVVLVNHEPLSAIVLVPFSLAIAASRVVLGLHYPSDVLAGALLGSTIATLGVSLP